ncbi:carbonate dehydratase [Rhodocyclus tenuis]|uniref:carbonate dehydratase n=1 Tax=Rhodocyclus tenuis TaxID=1066 RepID=UPI001909002F|nr:carbonate dehydratase [Rhodocyclus tenuis]MBK1680271.1 carbonate dehydratase [Rhodocyclus tenuis]
MPDLEKLFANNREWSARMTATDEGFFERLSSIQNPEYLWIGCSDSRVPANEILGLLPGEVFVHRNIANVVVHSDLNLLSVLQYAVDVLKVRRILIVGHYGCGGVRAAHEDLRLGLVDNWLRHIQDVRRKHQALLDRCADTAASIDRLCELNVIEQVLSVGQTTVLHDAWARGQEVFVHGWIFGLDDGLVRDLGITLGAQTDILGRYTAAIAQLEDDAGEPASVLPALQFEAS